MVAVIGRPAERVPEEKAWSYVAGVMVGQDLSERTVQLACPAPESPLGKSFPGFGPIGPWLVTPDELADRDDLRLRCSVGGRVLAGRPDQGHDLLVPELVARISAVCPMSPGDLIFTGTPSGVGMGRKPPEFLRPGTTLVSTIEGLGESRNALVARPDLSAAAAVTVSVDYEPIWLPDPDEVYGRQRVALRPLAHRARTDPTDR